MCLHANTLTVPHRTAYQDTRSHERNGCVAAVSARIQQQSMPKAHKVKRNKRSRHDGEPAEYRMLTYAALGQKRKVAKLFDRHADLDVNFYDAHGCTALHQVQPNCFLRRCCLSSIRDLVKLPVQASRAGHEETVMYLLRSEAHCLLSMNVALLSHPGFHHTDCE